MNGKLKGNLMMFVAKTFSGLNQNALRYLLPNWMSAPTGVLLRLGFGSIFFAIFELFVRKKYPLPTWKEATILLFAGLILVFGYMWALLEGLSFTTPISSSIFISLQPVFVFIICLIIKTEKSTWKKIIGMLLGFGGALLCVLTQHSSEVASDPFKGNMFCLLGALLFSCYLVTEKRYIPKYGSAMVSFLTFFGGAVGAAILLIFYGWDAEVFHKSFFSTPFLVLLFVLIFPTSISYLLQDFSLKLLSATVVALYSDLILIVSAIASYIIGQDKFSWWQILAILLMLVSVYLVESSESANSPVINKASDVNNASGDNKE
ncbi:MAG: DMT family transporter [Muribaculaceae bacterium]|nr:DMT family transporter [Muribaculaceae bacterium]